MKIVRIIAAALLLLASVQPMFGQAVVVQNCGVLAGGATLPIGSSGQSLYIDQYGELCMATGSSGGGAATKFKVLSAASNNSTLIKTGAGSLSVVVAINTTATVYFLKLYDKATAPTCGTDVPIQTYPVPASTAGAGFVIPYPAGLGFTLGLGLCLVGGLADNDNTNAAAGVAINGVYR